MVGRRPQSPLGEVFRYFLRLGVIAFGGPAAHIAIMRRELVAQRHWATDQELVDMLGVANLIPGPNSTELAMHFGAQRAGWRGLWLAGLAFIAPAASMTLALAYLYVRYGSTPTGKGILLGIQPFMLAIVVQAIWGLKGAALKGIETFILVFVVAALAVAGAGEVLLIFASGAALLLIHLVLRVGTHHGRRALRSRPLRRPRMHSLAPVFLAATERKIPLTELFLIFLKIGATLYGSGYVLLSFMQSEFVDQRAWLTKEQLVDAISAGQFTPGPVFSTAAFAGYVMHGWQGGILAAVGIFLPSFIFVNLTHPFVGRMRRSSWAAPFLDGVNAAALALMVVVIVSLALDVLDRPYTVTLFVAGAFALLRFNPNSAWLVLAGICAGLAYAAVT